MAKMRGVICEECQAQGAIARFASESALQMHKKAKHPLRAPLPPLGKPPQNSLHYRMPGTGAGRDAAAAQAPRTVLGMLRSVVLWLIGITAVIIALGYFAKVTGL